MIDSIIFDVGKVLVDFDWLTPMKKRGYTENTIQSVSQAMFLGPWWNEVDRGALSSEELVSRFISLAPEFAPEIRDIYSHLDETIDLFPHTMNWITDLKKRGYKLYILSNYGEDTYLQTEHKLSFLPLMDGALFSYRYKKIKPEPEIYQILLSKYSIDPHRAVFLDDRQENLDAAATFGIHTILFHSFSQAHGELELLLHQV